MMAVDSFGKLSLLLQAAEFIEKQDKRGRG